ncbi:ROK family transcriptional regulator [Rhizobium sp. C4]|uniref:ROK family transcriptional regulator n=1 Tax=Rhizobium sp. C4 TaxID=1349800 RepID=UPI001E5A0CC1|nr:ROK family transcriptional regulator [Rhizobium sp. C4]MCD2172319.1 ROK family transcriptional regulator [Rhizobium sp. C4]
MQPSYRSRNIRHEIITLLQQSGPLSRADLARRIGIARSTITGAVGALIDEGLVEEMETVPVAGRGRPATTIALAQGAGAAVGIDFGFRHVRGVVADLQHNILAIEERELGADYEFDAGIEAAFDIIDRLSQRANMSTERLLGVGIGLPCPTSNEGVTTRSAMIPKWSGRNVLQLFSERLPMPFVVENESRLAARGESVWGAAKGVENFIYLKLHSGVGGAVVAGGHFISGQNGGAGELGHISLDPQGPICRCGNRGCLEVYAGIPAVLAQARPVHADITLARLMTLYGQGDPAVTRIMADTARRVAQALSMLCNTLNPELVLIGGSLAGAGERFIGIVQDEMKTMALELNRAPRMERGALGRNASALGGVARVFELFAGRS